VRVSHKQNSLEENSALCASRRDGDEIGCTLLIGSSSAEKREREKIELFDARQLASSLGARNLGHGRTDVSAQSGE